MQADLKLPKCANTFTGRLYTVALSIFMQQILFCFKFELLRVQPCLLGDSGGVVNSLDFFPASLKSLDCFYFRCVLSSQWKGGDSEFANFKLPTLKAFLEACSHNVSGNKQ